MNISRAQVLATGSVMALFLALSVPAQAQVVINEINYNPAGASDLEEFLELYNRGAAAVDVSGWSIADAITLTIPSGTSIPAHGYLVVALSPVDLQAATGYAGAIAWTSGNLSNGGEIITLRDAALTTVDVLTYDDVAPWPTSPDDGGPSLELINPVLDNGVAASWAPSLGANGTPGVQNSVFSNAAAVESETPARHSAVAALTSVSVTFTTSVTGVTSGSLTVGGSAATTLSCPACSGGAGVGPYLFSGFAAPAPGSVAIVLSGAGILAGSVPFGGDSWTVAVGINVAINELHYHPPDAVPDAEFLELYNAGAAPVVMTGWKFSSGVTGTFPPGTTLPAGGYLVFAKVPALLQANTGYAGAIAWASGSLSNGGETVAIVDADNNLIDDVPYSDSGAWPTPPDGDGPTLELVNPGLPNQYGSAWRASLANWGTPGAQNSVFLAAPPPIITDPAHTPIIPAPNQSITVTALIFDDEPAPPTVTLYYRQDLDPTIAYSSTPMLDDGLHGDGAAGDNLYGAVVPGLPDGERLDFTIRADDGMAISAAPIGNDTLNAGEYPSQTFLAKFSSGPSAIDFPHYHLITTQHTRNLQNTEDETEYDATFVRCTPPSGTCELFYNIVERYRGQSSLHQHPHGFRIGFSSGHPLQSEMGFTLTKLNLMSQQPDRQFLGYQFFREAFGGSIPTAKTQFVRLDTNPLSHGGIQDYAYVNVEKEDENFLDSEGGAITPLRFPGACSVSLAACSADADCPVGQTCAARDSGNIYKGVLTGDLQYLGTNPDSYRTGYEKETNGADDVWTDLMELTFALDPDTTPDASFEASVNAIADENEWARWFAIHMLLVNQEGGIYRDSGDDFYVYLEAPGSPLGYNTKFIPRDQDSVFGGFGTFAQETIWRTTVQTPQRFLRNNAYAGRFVGAICDLLNTDFTQAVMDARIDALPNAIADASKKAQFKSWVAARIAYVNGEIHRDFTVSGVPTSPYTAASPVIALGGNLNQCGTYRIAVNGQPATYSIYNATWSRAHTLNPGINNIVIQEFDHTGAEIGRLERSVIYNPPGSLVDSLRLEMPRRMFNDKTLTLRAEVLDPIRRIASDRCDELGSVSVTRVSDGSPVPSTITVFDAHIAVPADSIRFYNGVGSVSLTLDDGAAVPPGDIRVTVTLGSLAASKVVTVEAAPVLRALSGTLSGAGLTWGPDENIQITGNATVPSGSTLTINPGTLIMVDTTGGLDNGTLITVQGNVSAQGTEDRPIHFFSTAGPAAMTLTQSGGASNPNSWRGIHHFGGESSTYRHVFLTGAGNGVVVSHPRPPILSFNDSHSFLIEDSTLVDDDGMAIAGPGTGTYTVRRSLISRDGIGAEFNGNGHTLLVEDSWWTSCGWAPEAENLDGDLIHVDGPSSNQTIRRSIFADGGDDGIDHNGSNFSVDSIIIRTIRDKAISMTGGSVNVTNSLIFDTGSGIRGSANVTQSTIAVGAPVATVLSVDRSVIWSSSIPTCPGSNVNYTIVGSPADLGCGTGNLSVNPQYTAPASCNYAPAVGSPAITAGPGGTRIGWLGFPAGDSCATDTDCDDGNACSFDTCAAGACSYAPIANCAPCAADTDCNDGNACTDDTCDTGSGTCVFTADDTNTCSDGVACTTDTCQAGVCAGVDACPGGSVCNSGTGLCTAAPVSVTFQDGVAGYTGTQDTWLAEAAVSTVNGAVADWRWDTDDPSGSGFDAYGLIRFDGIFGSGAGQIPPGSVISMATLHLTVWNSGVAPAGAVHEVLADWSEATATWNNFGGDPGVDPTEYGALVGSAPIALGAASIDVTSSLQAWSAAPASNLGWVFVPASTDGLQVRSAEYATTPAERPFLSVTFTAPSTECIIDNDCADGLFCNGIETCVGGLCQPGTAVDCSDGIVCTADTCDEANDVCLHAPVDAVCEDGNVCTTNTCMIGAGCVLANNTLSCNDANACTTGDVCGGGTCAGTALSCDDGVACTADSCDTAIGCIHADTCTGGQTCNLGTGVCETPSAPPLPIANGATWSYFKGTAAPTAGWNQVGFDDSTWDAGPSGFGYGPDCTATRGTLLGDMLSPPATPGYVSLYVRHEFYVANPAVVTTLTFTVDYDDAFVTYINGQEVARSANILGTPPLFSTLATADHECSVCNGTCNAAQMIALSPSVLQPGVNVIAIQAHNLTLNSSDFTLLPSLASVEQPITCTTDPQCDDGLYCNGVETCVAGSCQAGAVVNCSDGVACTTDSCDEAGDTCLHADACTGGATCNLGTGVCEGGSVQSAFQDGTGGYTGTVDTYLHAGSPTANNSLATPLIVDGPLAGAEGDERQILLRFDNLFVSQGGPIPDGAAITAATLTLNITNPSVDGAQLHRMVIPWSDTDTWNSLVSGVQVDGSEALAAVAAASLYNGTVPATHDIDVTTSVAAWSAAPATNHGWVLVTPPGGSDSWQFDSSEGATVALRPRLSVSYVSAPVCLINADCDDGLFCNGAETCVAGACQPGAVVDCNDGVACSVDTCNEATDSCDHAACTVTVAAAGSRYLAVTPPAGLSSVALRVTSAGLACLPKYVDATGHLVAAPVFQSSAAWGTVYVTAREIAPSRAYDVTAEVVAGTPIGGGTTTTWAWGDVDNQDGVNLFDILCVLDATQGSFPHCTLHGVDLYGTVPNGVADTNDIGAVLDAFASVPYPDADPCGPPPPAAPAPQASPTPEKAPPGGPPQRSGTPGVSGGTR